MSENRHTPGPWRLMPAAVGEPDTEVLACPPGDPEGRLVAAVHDTADTEGEANARLIAAAPDLLAACEAVLLFHRGGPWLEETQALWKRLTGQDHASTRSLCDFVRSAVNSARGA